MARNKSHRHEGDSHDDAGSTRDDLTDDQSAEHRRPVRNDDSEARDRFGGLNIGAAFFGWLVAIGIAVLLTSIIGAIAAGIGYAQDVTQSQAQREAGTVGLTAGIVLIVVLLLAYYTGGYVAGRMSRFDGARQGLGVWVVGLVVTVLAVVAGVAFGSEYNILDRVSLPRLPIPTDQMTTGGIIAGVVILLGTLLAAMAGGKVGHRYHDKVDRAAF